MSNKDYEAFFNLLHRIVNGEGPYRERKRELLQHGSEGDLDNLEEFASWGWEH